VSWKGEPRHNNGEASHLLLLPGAVASPGSRMAGPVVLSRCGVRAWLPGLVICVTAIVPGSFLGGAASGLSFS
jgi:hypothetical protein